MDNIYKHKKNYREMLLKIMQMLLKLWHIDIFIYFLHTIMYKNIYIVICYIKFLSFFFCECFLLNSN